MKHAISIDRLREVLDVKRDGLIVFKVDNVRYRAGDLPQIKHKNGRRYINIDGKRLDLARVAWAVQQGRWPPGWVFQRRFDHFDYSLRNLRVSGKT